MTDVMTEKVLPAPLSGEMIGESVKAQTEYVCPRCKRRFKSAQGLKTHMTRAHKKSKSRAAVKRTAEAFNADKPLALLYPNGVPAREADLRAALALVDQFKAIHKTAKKSR